MTFGDTFLDSGVAVPPERIAGVEYPSLEGVFFFFFFFFITLEPRVE